MVDNANQNEHIGNTFSLMNLIKAIAIFWVVRRVANTFISSNNNDKQSSHANNNDSGIILHNVWDNGQHYNIELRSFDRKSKMYEFLYAKSDLVYNQKNQTEYKTKLSLSNEIINDDLRKLPIKVTFYRTGLSPNATDLNYDQYTFTKEYDLIKKRSKTKNVKMKNLMGGDVDKSVDKILDEGEYYSFLHPSFNLQIVANTGNFSLNKIPELLKENLKIDLQKKIYYPVVYWDNFWTLSEDLVVVNQTKTNNNYSLDFSMSTVSFQKFIMKTSVDKSFRLQSDMFGSMGDELEIAKRMFRDVNPYFLGLTMTVSMLHFVFEILAFKNEISFWKNKSDLHGLSVRTIFVELFCSAVIFLYLFENETSWMVIGSSFMNIFILLWKLTKAFKVEFGGSFGINLRKKSFVHDGSSNDIADQHDRVAVKYLCFALLPLAACYSCYSLFYETHKSWYQWVLNSLVGSVYTFGFIMMCPQLYINYKLKSVAHLPWRMMTYKALNTVIDDLFAFVIKMPVLHRVACFRDDVVFGVFLYQMWKYKVDFTRTNEFGYTPVKACAEEDVVDNGDKKKKE